MNRKMKDSGVEWIGEIPEDWEVSKVKNIFKIGRGRVISGLELKEDGQYPVYSSQTKNNGCMGYINTYDYNISQLTWTTDGVYAGTVFIRQGKHNCTNVCGTLQLKNELNNLKYLKYILEFVVPYHKRKDINGGKIMNNEMANITIVIANILEQEQIANFLDKKCTQIDALIQNQQQQIEKLKQYKQSLITETVTKGLEPNVPMKDSGVEWIGEIPENWEVRKIKFVSSVEKELWSEKYLDKNINYIGLENIESGNGKKIETNSIYEKDKSLIYKEKDILFGKLRPYLAKVYLAKEIGCCSSEFCVIRTNTEYLSNYIWAVLISKSFIDTVNFSTYGTKMPRANTDFIKNMQIPIPPFEEQEKIATYLDKKCSQIDNLIKIKEEKIQKLNDYKKSIIYEYVTGKKEA